MRCGRAVRASGCQWQSRNSPCLVRSQHPGAAYEAALNNVHKKCFGSRFSEFWLRSRLFVNTDPDLEEINQSIRHENKHFPGPPSSLPLLPPATTPVFGSYLSFLFTHSCLSKWLERFRGSQKEAERGPLGIQSSLASVKGFKLQEKPPAPSKENI
jgi:hypothetical protein